MAMKKSNDLYDCSGCSLCLLVCPVWRKTRDFSLTPLGRAKSLQNGREIETASVESCTLCMACNPVCPEQIDQVEIIAKLRRQRYFAQVGKGEFPLAARDNFAADEEAGRLSDPVTGLTATRKLLTSGNFSAGSQTTVLIPDSTLLARPDTLARIVNLLGGSGEIILCEDDGSDLSLALESGTDLPELRLKAFLAAFKPDKKIIVADGLLLYQMKRWLPAAQLISLGEALGTQPTLRSRLLATDLYVIEARAYHADYQRLVRHYDKLRAECGSTFNLDLQRIAIPATSRSLPQRLGLLAHEDVEQAQWILKGRNIKRIVVEHFDDYLALEKVSTLPIIHLADLLKDKGLHA